MKKKEKLKFEKVNLMWGRYTTMIDLELNFF